MLSSLWSYGLRLCGELSMTSTSYAAPPYSFLLLLQSGDPLAAALRQHRGAWVYLERMESTRCDKDCQSLLDACTIGLQQFCREIFIQLLEVDFAFVPPLVEHSVRAFGNSFMSSLLCEEQFNACRKVQKSSRVQKLELDSIYHCVSVGGKVMESFGRRQVPITAAAPSASVGHVPGKCFGVGELSQSLASAELDHLNSPEPDWPTLGPQALKQSVMGGGRQRKARGSAY